jgi:hypothetical protein
MTLRHTKIAELVTVYYYFDLVQRKEEKCDAYQLQKFIIN